MKKKSGLVVFWDATWPLVIYSAAQIVITLLGMIVMGMVSAVINADADGMVDQAALISGMESLSMKYAIAFVLIAALVCIPIYYKIIKKDRERAGEVKRNVPMTNKDILVIVVSSAALALAANNIIGMTPLPIWFPGYEDVNETIVSGGVILQILSAGIFGCIVEELSLRGVTYLRMKRFWGKRKAMIWSAIVFGVYHMNVVQAVYAFFLGIFFAWLYERYDTLWAPIIAHMSANLFVLLLSENSLMNKLFNSLVGFCLLTCISVLIFYYGWRYMKQTNPLVELEFIEKEPDTLQGLTEEYKEHNQE